MTAAVFLDRDNTLIVNDGDLGDPDQVRLVQGAASAIASLCGLGYRVVVVTNQGGVARGKYTEADVRAVHERIRERVSQGANGARIDGFYFCPFHPEAKLSRYRDADHADRKPRPGLLLKAAEDHRLDLKQSWMIGDQPRDIEAGAAAGTRTVLLRAGADHLTTPAAERAGRASGSGAVKVSSPAESTGAASAVTPDFEAKNLVEAVRLIAQSRKPESGEELSRMQVGGKRWDTAAIARLQHPRTQPTEPREAAKSREDEESKKADEDEESGGGARGRGEAKPAGPPAKVGAAKPKGPKLDEAGGGRGGRGGGESQRQNKPTAPFRPWNAPPQPDPGGGIPPLAEQPEPPPAPSPPSPTQPEPKPEPASSRPSPPEPAPPRAQTTAAPENMPPAATPDTPHASSAPPAPPGPSDSSAPPDARLLRSILQELRQQRGGGDDFTMAKIVAMVLQTIAAVCLLGGLWMGADDPVLFLKWIGAGLMIQMATIAVLLFSR